MTEGSVLEESWLGWGSSGWESRMEAGFYLIWGGLGEVGVPLLLSRLSPPCASGATGQHGGDMPSPLHPLHLAAWGRVSSHVWNRRAPIVPWGLSTVDLVLSPVPPWYLGPMGTSLTDAGELGGVRYL